MTISVSPTDEDMQPLLGRSGGQETHLVTADRDDGGIGGVVIQPAGAKRNDLAQAALPRAIGQVSCTATQKANRRVALGDHGSEVSAGPSFKRLGAGRV